MFYSSVVGFLFCFGSVRTIEPGNIASNPHCDFPPLDFDAMPVDVLGDREKGNVCKLPRPAHLCERGKGPADEFCKKIARAVGGTSNASCFRKKTCTFHVKRPIQHPDEPGEAYVSLCVPDYAGVIWPCRENNLVIINPFYNTIDAEYGDELTQDAPNWDEGCSNNTARPSLPSSNKKKTKGYDLFGKYVAHKLINMDPIQTRIAERFISEILFEGAMGNLNRHVKMAEISSPLPLQTNVDQSNTPQHNLESEDSFASINTSLTNTTNSQQHILESEDSFASINTSLTNTTNSQQHNLESEDSFASINTSLTNTTHT